jgi:hypothetical protein
MEQLLSMHKALLVGDENNTDDHPWRVVSI